MKSVRINTLDYIGFASLGYLILNNEKYKIVSSTKWIENMGFSLIYGLGLLFILKLVVMMVEDDSNVYLKRGKQLFTLLSGSLSFTFSYLLVKLIYMESNYSDSVKLKWNITIKRIWDKNELLNYLKEKIEDFHRSDILLDEKYSITRSKIKISQHEINELVSTHSTIEGLNKSFDDLINKKLELIILELEKNNSLISQLMSYIDYIPPYYFLIGGALVFGASCYYMKEHLILAAFINLKTALTCTNRGISGVNGAIRYLSEKINEIINSTNANTSNIETLSNELNSNVQILSSGINSLREHVGIQQALLQGLPMEQLRNPTVLGLLAQLLTIDNLDTLLELSRLMREEDAANFNRLLELLDIPTRRVGENLEPNFNLESRNIVRRGNIASFN